MTTSSACPPFSSFSAFFSKYLENPSSVKNEAWFRTILTMDMAQCAADGCSSYNFAGKRALVTGAGKGGLFYTELVEMICTQPGACPTDVQVVCWCTSACIIYMC